MTHAGLNFKLEKHLNWNFDLKVHDDSEFDSLEAKNRQVAPLIAPNFNF